MSDGNEALTPAQTRRRLQSGRDLMWTVATPTLRALPRDTAVPLTAAEPSLLDAGQIIAVARDEQTVLARFVRHDWTTVPHLVCATDDAEFMVDWDNLVGAVRVEAPSEISMSFTAP